MTHTNSVITLLQLPLCTGKVVVCCKYKGPYRHAVVDPYQIDCALYNEATIITDVHV